MRQGILIDKSRILSRLVIRISGNRGSLEVILKRMVIKRITAVSMVR